MGKSEEGSIRDPLSFHSLPFVSQESNNRDRGHLAATMFLRKERGQALIDMERYNNVAFFSDMVSRSLSFKAGHGHPRGTN